MAAKKILVTGANGQLGKEIQRLAPAYPQYEFVFADRTVLPIEDQSRVNDFFSHWKPYACINCAAYTAVDKAESEKDRANVINADAVGFLAEASAAHGSLFIHISTDYVFNGNSSIPYKEDDATEPINHYGLSKLLGEKRAIEKNSSSIIIRTSWVYSEYGNNFVKTMMRLMKEREILHVVNDQTGSPTYAADLAQAIMQIIAQHDGLSIVRKGIYHYSNEGSISWYDFAVAINELSGSSCKVNGIPSSQYPTPARRPHFSLLDKSKIKSTFKITIPGWKESLEKCIQRLKGG
jgi:dTDP-4-dehydrorhamnose reductase